ncbi:MAG: hypothetical protein CML20_12610 [Rheinheimera sp.]|nr:hypothetical protein [Rheinheimera sp.]
MNRYVLLTSLLTPMFVLLLWVIETLIFKIRLDFLTMAIFNFAVAVFISVLFAKAYFTWRDRQMNSDL